MKNLMGCKGILSVILVLAMAFCLCACSGSKTDSSGANSASAGDSSAAGTVDGAADGSGSDQTAGTDASADSGSGNSDYVNKFNDKKNAQDTQSQNADVDTSAAGATPGVDLDLTQLSSTVVYSEVYNMVNTPEDYMGKEVKCKGAFQVYTDETTGKTYFACIISDATACCAQGLEFVTKDDRSYPADYPEVGQEVTVTGEFNTYQEGDYTYCQLKNAVIEY